jgi:hypothetical protein
VQLVERSWFDMKKTEAGQALPVTLLLASLLFVAGSTGLGIVYDALHDRSRAQTAADAAALAGAAADEKAARLAAEANGGRLVSLTHPDGDTLATVEVDGSQARARAHQGRLRNE